MSIEYYEACREGNIANILKHRELAIKNGKWGNWAPSEGLSCYTLTAKILDVKVLEVFANMGEIYYGYIMRKIASTPGNDEALTFLLGRKIDDWSEMLSAATHYKNVDVVDKIISLQLPIKN